MTEAILKYYLPDDQDDFILALHGKDFWVVLFEFDQWLRNEIKYKDKDYQPVRDMLYELMGTYNVNLDMVS